MGVEMHFGIAHHSIVEHLKTGRALECLWGHRQDPHRM